MENRVKNQPVDVDVIPVASVPSRTTKVVNKFMIVALVIIAIGVGLFLKWSFQSEHVIQVNNEPFPVRTIGDTPESRGVLVLNVDFCKLQEAEGQLRISLINEAREVFLPASTENLPVGCEQREVPIVIPTGLIAGEYVVKFRTTYRLNPLKQSVVNEYQSEKIFIDPSVTQ